MVNFFKEEFRQKKSKCILQWIEAFCYFVRLDIACSDTFHNHFLNRYCLPSRAELVACLKQFPPSINEIYLRRYKIEYKHFYKTSYYFSDFFKNRFHFSLKRFMIDNWQDNLSAKENFHLMRVFFREEEHFVIIFTYFIIKFDDFDFSLRKPVLATFESVIAKSLETNGEQFWFKNDHITKKLLSVIFQLNVIPQRFDEFNKFAIEYNSDPNRKQKIKVVTMKKPHQDYIWKTITKKTSDNCALLLYDSDYLEEENYCQIFKRAFMPLRIDLISYDPSHEEEGDRTVAISPIVLHNVFSYLATEDMLELRLVCKTFSECVHFHLRKKMSSFKNIFKFLHNFPYSDEGIPSAAYYLCVNYLENNIGKKKNINNLLDNEMFKLTKRNNGITYYNHFPWIIAKIWSPTSFFTVGRLCEKYQVVLLKKVGIHPYLVDNYKLTVRACDYWRKAESEQVFTQLTLSFANELGVTIDKSSSYKYCDCGFTSGKNILISKIPPKTRTITYYHCAKIVRGSELFNISLSSLRIELNY